MYKRVDHVSFSFVKSFLVLPSFCKEHFQACWSACIWADELLIWVYQYFIYLLYIFLISFLYLLVKAIQFVFLIVWCITDPLHVVCSPPKVDGWTEIQKDLDKRPYSQWFTVIFIFLGHFIFTNLFIGIIIMASIKLKKYEYSSSFPCLSIYHVMYTL